MQCQKCQNELSAEADLAVETAAHDYDLIDMILTCAKCGAVHNTFVSIRDFVLIDDED